MGVWLRKMVVRFFYVGGLLRTILRSGVKVSANLCILVQSSHGNVKNGDSRRFLAL